MTTAAKTVEIAGHECEIVVPERLHPQGFTAIYLHGVHLQKLADHPEFVAPFLQRGIRLIGPRTGPHWWLDQVCPQFDPAVTPERYVTEHVLPWMASEWDVEPPKIALVGTSMGGQGALRIAYKRPRTFPVVAALAPAIDFHWKWREGDPVLRCLFADEEAARQQTALLYAQGFNCPPHQFFCCDPQDTRWWESADRLKMKLESMGVRFECDLETRAGGHGFDYYTAMAPQTAEFIERSLEAARLRLV